MLRREAGHLGGLQSVTSPWLSRGTPWGPGGTAAGKIDAEGGVSSTSGSAHKLKMTARLDPPKERRRFYLIVAAMVLTWTCAALVLGMAFGIPGDLGFAFTMAGIGGILVTAVRHPANKRLRSRRQIYSER